MSSEHGSENKVVTKVPSNFLKFPSVVHILNRQSQLDFTNQPIRLHISKWFFIPKANSSSFLIARQFRENIVRLLYIPSIVDQPHHNEPQPPSHLFLAVNKFGKVGLYHSEKFSLVHTYCLDLSVPILVSSKSTVNNPPITPKCERTHLVTDAAFSPDINCVIFSTTKNLLQFYDIGDIQKQDVGLSLFPRKEFLTLRENTFPVTNIPNKGHIECHRLLGLNSIPTCLEYHGRKLIIGDVEGGVTLIAIPAPKYPLGRRKIRGKLHKIHMSELPHGVVQFYKGHHHSITDIQLITERNLILTSSKDKKFSVYVKDLSDTPMESIIVSIPKGVNTIAYSLELKMVATGSDDYVVRLFNQFVMKMPQMEMFGHRSPVITVKFIQVDFFVVGAEQGENPVLLLSYSADSELRAWDPLTFICLQSLYLSFPIGSTIMCKTPEFATKSLLLFQPKGSPHEDNPNPQSLNPDKKSKKGKVSSKSSGSGSDYSMGSGSSGGTIILLYCNSYARIPLEKEGATRWPGIDYDKFIREFEDLSMEYDKKLKDKLKIDKPSKPPVHIQPHQYQVTPEVIQEEIEENEDKFPAEDKPKTKISDDDNVCLRLNKDDMSEMEIRVDAYLKEIMELRQTLRQTGSGVVQQFPPMPSSAGNTGRLSNLEDYGGDEEDEERGVFSSPSFGGGPEDPLTISIHATDRFFEFRRAKQANFQGLPKGLQRMISYGHAFNQYPLLELEPVQLSRKGLAVSEEMKRELGISKVNSIQDLMTPEAQKYFGIELLGNNGQRNRKNGESQGGSGGGGSFFYNFNHSQQRKKRSSMDHPHPQDDHVSQKQKKAVPGSRFTVVGQKIRNVYEDDENFLMDGSTTRGDDDGDEDEQEVEHDHIDFH